MAAGTTIDREDMVGGLANTTKSRPRTVAALAMSGRPG
jgi:hypothetical protein